MSFSIPSLEQPLLGNQPFPLRFLSPSEATLSLPWNNPGVWFPARDPQGKEKQGKGIARVASWLVGTTKTPSSWEPTSLLGNLARDGKGKPTFFMIFFCLPVSCLFYPKKTPSQRSARGKEEKEKKKVGWAMEDLNFRPHPYQGCALTN